MRIVIPSENQGGLEDKVAVHFGRCPAFTVIEAENDEIKKVETVKNPYFEQHMPFAVPAFLSTLKPDYVLCAGAGPRAVQALEEHGIEPIPGCSGSIKDVVESFLKNSLERSKNICEHGGLK